MDVGKKEKIDIYDLPTFEELASKQMSFYIYLTNQGGKTPAEAAEMLDERAAAVRQFTMQ